MDCMVDISGAIVKARNQRMHEVGPNSGTIQNIKGVTIAAAYRGAALAFFVCMHA